MNRSDVLRLGLAFALGVLLTLLLTSWPTNGRYVPLDPTRHEILDTRTGRLYGQGHTAGGKEAWLIKVQGVGR